MKLETVVFFSEPPCNDKNLILCHELQKNYIQVYWNPAYQDLGVSSPERTLVVTDTNAGVTFALQHNIPFLQKWTEGLATSETMPVCYYDRIDHLSYEYLINQWKRSQHLPITIAETPQLFLRELSIDDIPALYNIRQNPAILTYLPAQDSLEAEIEKHKSYIKYQYEFFDYGLWGIFLKDGTLIGQAGIQNTEYEDHTFLELSYLIAPDYQKHGFATEAILAIYEYVQTSLELNELVAIIAQNNLPSIRTAMDLGMLRRSPVEHLGYDCNYYVIENISDFLTDYQQERKRKTAAKSAYRSAQKNPVQHVYSKYRK